MNKIKKEIAGFCLTFLLVMLLIPGVFAEEYADEEQFLADMAEGITARLADISKDEASMSKEEKAAYYQRLVGYEFTATEKYEDAVFADSKFDTYAHLYIDACKMQDYATRHYKNEELYDSLWSAGGSAHSGIIYELYQRYDLPITSEQAENYKGHYEVSYSFTDQNGNAITSPALNDLITGALFSSSSAGTTVSAGTETKPVSSEANDESEIEFTECKGTAQKASNGGTKYNIQWTLKNTSDEAINLFQITMVYLDAEENILGTFYLDSTVSLKPGKTVRVEHTVTDLPDGAVNAVPSKCLIVTEDGSNHYAKLSDETIVGGSFNFLLAKPVETPKPSELPKITEIPKQEEPSDASNQIGNIGILAASETESASSEGEETKGVSKEDEYQKGLKYIEEKDFDAAYECFVNADDYEDAADYAKNLKAMKSMTYSFSTFLNHSKKNKVLNYSGDNIYVGDMDENITAGIYVEANYKEDDAIDLEFQITITDPEKNRNNITGKCSLIQSGSATFDVPLNCNDKLGEYSLSLSINGITCIEYQFEVKEGTSDEMASARAKAEKLTTKAIPVIYDTSEKETLFQFDTLGYTGKLGENQEIVTRIVIENNSSETKTVNLWAVVDGEKATWSETNIEGEDYYSFTNNSHSLSEGTHKVQVYNGAVKLLDTELEVVSESVQIHKEDYEPVTGGNLVDDPEQYYLERLSIGARITQVVPEYGLDNSEILEFIASSDDGETIHIIIPAYMLKSTIHENDYVTVYGTGNKKYTYDTSGGSTNSVPEINAYQIEQTTAPTPKPTPTPTPTPTPKPFNKNSYSSVSGKDLARSIESYSKKNITFKAKVFQVVNESSSGSMWDYNEYLAKTDDDEQIVRIRIYGNLLKTRILDDDHITVYGTGDGLYTYSTLAGNSKTVPSVIGDRIELVKVEEECKKYVSRRYGDTWKSSSGQRNEDEFADFLKTLTNDEVKIVAKEWLKYSDHDQYFYEEQKEFTISTGYKVKLNVARDEKLYSFLEATSGYSGTGTQSNLDYKCDVVGHSIVATITTYQKGTIFCELAAEGMYCRFIIHVV